MAIRRMRTKCKVCGKEMNFEYEHDPLNPCPLSTLDSFAKMITCDQCMIKEGYAKREKPGEVMPPPPPTAQQSALPYNDD